MQATYYYIIQIQEPTQTVGYPTADSAANTAIYLAVRASQNIERDFTLFCKRLWMVKDSTLSQKAKVPGFKFQSRK